MYPRNRKTRVIEEVFIHSFNEISNECLDISIQLCEVRNFYMREFLVLEWGDIVTETTLNTVGQLLQDAAEETNDSEARYKINSARQLLKVVERDKEIVDERVDEVVDDEETLERLHDLDYLGH